MKKIRNSIKTFFLFKCWLLRCFLRLFSNKKEIAVLMYHSIDSNKNWKYGVYPKTFQKQLNYLSKNKKIVALNDIVNYVKGEKDLPDGSVALTFDDGYDDTYLVVFPLIKKYQVPVTVFLTTNLSETPKLGNLPRLKPEQIKEMAQSDLVKFEVHGRNHLNLSEISNNTDLLKEEIIGCRQDIISLTGKDSKYIAYAAGHKNNQVISFLKENDFETGFTITEGMVKKNSDLFLIKRIQIDRTMNFVQFKMRLTAAVDINRKFVDLFRFK